MVSNCKTLVSKSISILYYSLIYFAFLLFFPLSVHSYSGPFYVATNGNDSNNGSSTNPFATIQKAVDLMSAGPPICSNATCYISPGIYTQNVLILSNKNSDYMVITALSNSNPPVLNGLFTKNFGIKITNVGKVEISHLIIKNYNNYGIILRGTATNNRIVNNIIFSNNEKAIFINSSTGNNNSIISNHIYGTNQNTGIHICDGNYNTIYSNIIHNNNIYGICIEGNAISNNIIKNRIYSNAQSGIIISNTSYNNYVNANNIYAQSVGIFIYSKKNTIRSNQIYKHTSNGIFLTNNAVSNIIIINTIYSNNNYGILINSETADDNYIMTNSIWGTNQNSGICIIDSDNNKIYRNLIRNNQNYGIYINASTNIEIINNTIYGNLNEDGVYWTDGATGKMYNNIILSNGNGSGDYGIQNSGTGTVYVGYNDIYGNIAGATNGNLNCGNGNVFTDPMIDTVTSFTITLVISPAVDSGTNIPGVTDNANGGGPDMGWKESPFWLTAPSKPEIVYINAISYYEIQIIWNDLPNESSYTLFRNNINDTNSVIKIAGFTFNETNYLDTSLKPEETYYYWVKAYNRLGISPFSDVKSTITKSIYYKLPFKVFPTCFNPQEHNKVKIFFRDDKPEIEKIKIYDVAGNIVKTWNEKISGKKYIEWDGKDDNGQELDPGVYIIHIKGKNIDEKVKMILIK